MQRLCGRNTENLLQSFAKLEVIFFPFFFRFRDCKPFSQRWLAVPAAPCHSGAGCGSALCTGLFQNTAAQPFPQQCGDAIVLSSEVSFPAQPLPGRCARDLALLRARLGAAFPSENTRPTQHGGEGPAAPCAGRDAHTSLPESPLAAGGCGAALGCTAPVCASAAIGPC